MLEIQDEFDLPFEAIEPAECRGPVVFNSPHSGRVYPREFLLASRLDLGDVAPLRRSFVDDLIAGVVERGHPMVRAHFPRCYVDVNREPYELDPRMFDGRLPSFANTRSMRVAGGLGTVARVVGDAQEIYDQRIAVAEALRRIEGLYKPYHRALRRVFMRLHRDFGAAMLIDCHSMPSATGPRDERPRPIWCLATATVQAGACSYPRRSKQPCAASATSSAATNLMPAALSPSITAIRPPGCTPSNLRSTAALYMDERRYQRASSFAKLPANSKFWPIVSATFRSRNCGLTGRRQNRPPKAEPVGLPTARKTGEPKKKGRSPFGSGPSLGRKRPRRATAGEMNLSLPHCNNIHRDAQNARPVELVTRIFPGNLLQIVQSSSSIAQIARQRSLAIDL